MANIKLLPYSLSIEGLYLSNPVTRVVWPLYSHPSISRKLGKELMTSE